MKENKAFASFAEFYPFYLSQHQNRVCRRLHVAASLGIILFSILIFLKGNWMLMMILPVWGYGLAWIGHFFFEKNRPATFQYPLYSLIGDWVMLKDYLLGKIER